MHCSSSKEGRTQCIVFLLLFSRFLAGKKERKPESGSNSESPCVFGSWASSKKRKNPRVGLFEHQPNQVLTSSAQVELRGVVSPTRALLLMCEARHMLRVCSIDFHVRKYMFYLPLLVLKGIYHFWKYLCFVFFRGLMQMEVHKGLSQVDSSILVQHLVIFCL